MKTKVFLITIINVLSLVTVIIAFGVLITFLWAPVVKVESDAMSPTYTNGDILLTEKTLDVKSGDIVAFQYGGKLLLKRLVAMSGDTVDIKDGEIYVNGASTGMSSGDIDINEMSVIYPYTVPEGKYYLVGDNTEVSIDSRYKAVGCVSDEQIMGKVIFRIWPLSV